MRGGRERGRGGGGREGRREGRESERGEKEGIEGRDCTNNYTASLCGSCLPCTPVP